MAICLRPPQSPEDWREARRLIEQYASSLNVDLSFQNIEHELGHLSNESSADTGSCCWIPCRS